MMPAVLDHLWQSTLFALCAGLLTLAFRNNAASVRYWLWFSASMKFLVPFSLITAAVRDFVHPTRFSVLLPPMTVNAARDATLPFSSTVPRLNPEAALIVVWMVGAALVLLFWLTRWARIKAILKTSSPLSLGTPVPVPVRTCPAMMEPGLVGIWQPVLLLPQGIAAHLSASEMTAIIAHELGHLRRRDNLTSAIHMLVEALFWFHPLVWWLGARLIAERERACDESVLASGNDPQTYAESILKVCRFYVQSPLACAAGVSGANLKKRVEQIMADPTLIAVTTAKKALLGSLAVIVMAMPVLAATIVPQASEQSRRAIDDGVDCPTNAISLGCNLFLARTTPDPLPGSGLTLPQWANSSAPPPPSPPVNQVNDALVRALNARGFLVEMTGRFAADGKVTVTVDRSNAGPILTEFCKGLITTPQWRPGTINGMAQSMRMSFKCGLRPLAQATRIQSLNSLPPHNAPYPLRGAAERTERAY